MINVLIIYLAVGLANLISKYALLHNLTKCGLKSDFNITTRNWYKTILVWPYETYLLVAGKRPFQ